MKTERFSSFFSSYLDFLRIFSAVVVVVSHYPLTEFQAAITTRFNFGYDAVVVFFVLSGYVISYAADQVDKTWKYYVINRCSRIFPVSIAAVVVSFLLLWFLNFYGFIGAGSAEQLNNVPYVSMVSVFFLNEVWWTDLRPFGNGPYWSLSFEVWCYVIYGFCLFLRGYIRIFFIFFAFLITGPKQVLIFPIWFAGVLAYKYRNKFSISRRNLWSLAIFPLIGYFIVQLSQPRDWSYPVIGYHVEHWLGRGLDGAANFGWGYILSVLVSVHLFAVNRLEAPKLWGGGNAQKWLKILSGYTFSLYIFHYPLFLFFNAVFGIEFGAYKLLDLILAYSCTLFCIFILATVFEHRKKTYRALLARFLFRVERL